MNRDTLQAVLAAEAAAEILLEEARKEAEGIATTAVQDAQRLVLAMAAEDEMAVARIRSEAEAAAEALEVEARKESDAACAALLQKAQAHRAAAVQLILERIVNARWP